MDTHTLVRRNHLLKKNHFGKPHTLSTCKNEIHFRDDETMAEDLIDAIGESQTLDSVKKSKDHTWIYCTNIFQCL